MTFSKVLALASFALIAGTAPGWAADWGSVKDMGGGVPVPVPAPAPVPTFDADSDWYVGLAIGANISQNATIKDTDRDYLGDTTSGVWARDAGNIGTSPVFGLNFGRYITPSLRAEIAIDYTPDAQISRDDRLGHAVHPSGFDFATGTVVTNDYAVTRTDTVKLARTTGLINLLYDIPTGTRFTPYIGGGVGFTWRSLRRSYSENYACIGTCSPDAAPSTGSPISGSSSKQQLDFAAAVQAGIAYNITDQIVWDNGWQMLWEANSIESSAPSASGENTIVYKDSTLQQFRSGIRIRFD